MGWLILKDADGKQSTVEIPRESPLVVGRSSRAHISIDGTTVSRKHLLLQHKNKADWVQDAGSRNGSLLNGAALTRPRRLTDGDCIEVGEHRLFYSRRNPASPVDAADDDDTDIDDTRPRVERSVQVEAPVVDSRLLSDGRRWRQVTLIGRGGMGEVYRAFDRDLGELVAVKRLRRTGSGPRALLETLHAREAAIGRTIQHPNVVRVLEDGVHEGDPFLLLEWVEGKSLDRVLREGAGRLGSSLEIIRQTALGLEAAHEAGVVHADMKPANVLVFPEYDEEWLMTNLDILESPDQAADELPEDWVREIEKHAPEPEEPDFDDVPFVGREGELALLGQIAEEAKAANEPRWVLLLGASGVGKRRLVSEYERAFGDDVPLRVTEELDPPEESAGALLQITILPPTLPDDRGFLSSYERATRDGSLYELYLKPFLRGQAIRLVERLVGHPGSARDFVDAVEQEVGGYPERIVEVLRRSFQEGAWSASGGGYRFRGQRFFHSDEAAATRLLLEEFEREEKGLKDLLVQASPLGASMDFDTLLAATGVESAALYYLLGHGVKAGYLARERGGLYRFALEPFRLTLIPRLQERQRVRTIRAALPVMTKRLEGARAPLQLYLDTAALEEQDGHGERAFRWYLQGALKARELYDRPTFIRCLDGARQSLRDTDRARPSRAVMALLEEHLGSAGRGLSGLDRLRKLPTQVRVKIADFGVSRRTDEAAETQGTAWGTPRYMSPEQARKEALTPASDVFSLAIVAREVLEGVHPLGDLRGRGAVVAILDDALSDLTQRAAFLPEEVRRLLHDMLELEPAKRPTAGEVARRLQAIQVRLSTTEYG